MKECLCCKVIGGVIALIFAMFVINNLNGSWKGWCGATDRDCIEREHMKTW